VCVCVCVCVCEHSSPMHMISSILMGAYAAWHLPLTFSHSCHYFDPVPKIPSHIFSETGVTRYSCAHNLLQGAQGQCDLTCVIFKIQHTM
jgi:hypothetical protein